MPSPIDDATMMLKSRFVVPVDSPAIENGAVIVRDGRIIEVGPAQRFRDRPLVDYGDAVICPGFVNAHTHLELSHLAGRVTPSPDFTGWLQRLFEIAEDEPPTPGQVRAAVASGTDQSLSAGVTTVGDITRFPQWTRESLADFVLRVVSFGEVAAIGRRRHLLAERLDAAADVEHQTERLRIGISPHAPYTVEPEAMRACATRAREIDAPLCIHLAETADEEHFTRSGEGRFAEFLRAVEVWDEHIPTSGCGLVEAAARAGLLTSNTIVAHANYVTPDDIAMLADSGASVAFCPRTHRAFGHGLHRFREMLTRGINVCLGTDSLASNPSLSILDELRFLRREYGDLSSDQIMAMGTLNGARALGFAETAGSLAVGKAADLVVIPLECLATKARWDLILESDQPPSAVYVSGVQAYFRDSPLD